MSFGIMKMLEFINLREGDSFFTMPEDSLITLSAHVPVWQTIMHYLPADAKLNLLASKPSQFKDKIKASSKTYLVI